MEYKDYYQILGVSKTASREGTSKKRTGSWPDNTILM